MTVPLVVLAFLSVFGGIINLPFHPNFLQLEHWLNPVIGNRLFNHHFTPTTEILFRWSMRCLLSSASRSP